MTDATDESSRRELGGWTVRVLSTRDPVLDFAASVAHGLDRRPRAVEARWLYDARGSQLFEAITQLPEYPLTRAEDALLAARADELADLLGPVTLVELGSGSSAKTRRLLDAFVPRGARLYVPIDVSATALEEACAALARRYPELVIEGRVGRYEEGLGALAAPGPRLLLFLGSSLGNLSFAETDAFFAAARQALVPGDHLLLGLDGVKPVERTLRAYADPGGLTEAFVLNVFARMNRELGAAVPLDHLELVTRWDPTAEQVVLLARARAPFDLHLTPLGRTWRIGAGEEILVEVSRKFRPERVAAQAARQGLTLRRVFEDPVERYALLLLAR